MLRFIQGQQHSQAIFASQLPLNPHWYHQDKVEKKRDKKARKTPAFQWLRSNACSANAVCCDRIKNEIEWDDDDDDAIAKQ